MTKGERLFFWSSLGLAGGTGIAYGLARWFGERAGEFGPEPHPWQGTLQHLHVMGVPLLVFALGWMLKGHGMPGLKAKQRRISGLGLLSLAIPMVLSGYGIQVATSPAVQLAFRWIHGVSAGLFLLACAVHAYAAASVVFGKVRQMNRDRRSGRKVVGLGGHHEDGLGPGHAGEQA